VAVFCAGGAVADLLAGGARYLLLVVAVISLILHFVRGPRRSTV
jgi:hypothetical protein